jgi:hypothetical protein
MSKAQNEVLGIIFPLLPEHIRKFFDEEKTVFVKFIGRNNRLNVRSGYRLFMYQSRTNKEVVAEAKISEVSSGTVDEVLRKFGDKLFLSESELRQYAGDRMDKNMIVLLLTSLRKYSVPLKMKKPITMTGQYMTKQMYESLKEPIRSTPQTATETG